MPYNWPKSRPSRNMPGKVTIKKFSIDVRKSKFSGPDRIQGTCDMTLHLAGVHSCHILRYRLRKMYRYSLSAKKRDDNFDLEGICMVKVDSHVVREQCNEENPKGLAFCALEVTTIDCCQLEIRGE